MELLRSFLRFIRQEHLFMPTDRLLLAVSGGLDSTVLCALCHEAGFGFAIAHCNFRLRGTESDRDETFVRELAQIYDVPFYLKQFDTLAYAREKGISIQVAARGLRYEWFFSLLGRDEEAPGILLTAHHLDDNIETSLMNFFRGTGIAGLRGMLPLQHQVARPLLFARREDLLGYARSKNLRWVEDSSNQEEKYTRNYFRQTVLPMVEAQYPGTEKQLAAGLHRFRETELIYNEAICARRKKLLKPSGSEWKMPVALLKREKALSTVLFELCREFGFSAAQVPDIASLLDAQTGRHIASATHRIIKTRQWLLIAALSGTAATAILVEEGDHEVVFPGGRLYLRERKQAGLKPDPQPNKALLAAHSFSFPLLLRPWKEGDYFYPLGMNKKKKLARFFIDQKLSKTDKEKVWVLESDKKIIWVLGMRINERCKLLASDTHAWEFTADASQNNTGPSL